MIINKLIKDIMKQQNIEVECIVKQTKLSYKRVDEIVMLDIIPTPKEAKEILKILGVKLEDVLSLY